MLRLTIILLLFSFTEESRHEESSVLIPKVKNDSQTVIQSKNGVDNKLGSSDQTKHISIESVNPVFGTHGLKGADGTLEGCFGGLGRWLSLKNNSKKGLRKKKNCSCRCHATRGKSRCIKTSGNDGSTSETCYIHVSTKDCKTISNPGYKRTRTSDKGNFKDTKPSSLRLDPCVSTTATQQNTVLDSGGNAVSGTVQHHEGTRVQRKKTYRNGKTVTRGSDECCCEKCCRACYDKCFEPSFLLTCGTLVWCIDQGCRSGCDAFCRCLDKCPCC